MADVAPGDNEQADDHAPPTSLLLRLKRKWFDAIVGGYKTEEYRKASEYWRSRIENRTYDTIMFRNGYGPTRPTVLVEYKGWGRVHAGGDDFYAIRLGKPLKMWNFELPSTLPCPSQCSSIGLCPTIQEMEQQLQYSPLHHMWLPRTIPQLSVPVQVVPLADEASGEPPSIAIPFVEEDTSQEYNQEEEEEEKETEEVTFHVSCAPTQAMAAPTEEELGIVDIEMAIED